MEFMKILFSIAMLLVSSCAYAISPAEAEKHIGEVVTIEGEAVCVDFVHRSINFGFSERVGGHIRKHVIFRAVVQAGEIDLKEYFNWPVAITGRIQFDEGERDRMGTGGYDWNGGPQIIIINKWQIKVIRPPQKTSDPAQNAKN